VLDQGASDLATDILRSLSPGQRTRLVSAMAEVERLLVASMVHVEARDPAHPHARACVQAYFSELSRRFSEGFDPAVSTPVAEQELRPPGGLLLLATLHTEPVGCGGLRFDGDATAEIKRMWVAPTARGLGLGRRLLTDLESRAAGHGVRTLRLETNRALREAIGLYRASGYQEVAPFNGEPYADHWFEKRLPAC
jgi:GNAT superfamily N-acetyltransferase